MRKVNSSPWTCTTCPGGGWTFCSCSTVSSATWSLFSSRFSVSSGETDLTTSTSSAIEYCECIKEKEENKNHVRESFSRTMCALRSWESHKKKQQKAAISSHSTAEDLFSCWILSQTITIIILIFFFLHKMLFTFKWVSTTMEYPKMNKCYQT